MQESADKHLDDLSRKVIGKSMIASPSLDFTPSIMSQIKRLSRSNATTYVPLISKRMWSLIVIGVIALFAFVIFGTSGDSNVWLQRLTLDKFNLNNLTKFEFSKTLLYAVVLFAFMICIQIPMLKRFLDKRYEA